MHSAETSVTIHQSTKRLHPRKLKTYLKVGYLGISTQQLQGQTEGQDGEFRILPFSRLIRGVRWLELDISRLPIGPIFKNQSLQGVQETEELSATAAEAYELAW